MHGLRIRKALPAEVDHAAKASASASPTTTAAEVSASLVSVRPHDRLGLRACRFDWRRCVAHRYWLIAWVRSLQSVLHRPLQVTTSFK